MSTIKITNRPNAEGLREKSKEEFIKEYSKVISKKADLSKDVVEFSEIMAKHPADVYIVPSFEAGQKCEQIRQGDVYLFRAGDKSEGTLNNTQYDRYISTLSDKKETKSMNLQFGDSITGDHKIVPLKSTDVKIYEATIQLPIASFRGDTSPYEVKLVEANGPFVVAHREHGNITCPKGTYLACVQIDARSMTRMRD